MVVNGYSSFLPKTTCTIGRAPDNSVVLDDPRASRYHAHINQSENGLFTIVDGAVINNQLRRSANKVFINGEPQFDHQLKTAIASRSAPALCDSSNQSKKGPPTSVTTTSLSVTRNC